MILLLTLAGRTEPFIKGAYNTPRYLLPWGETTILSTIVAEFLKLGIFDDVVLIANKRDEAYMPHVRAILAARGIAPDKLVLTTDTSGQAETAMIGMTRIESLHGATTPIVINNVDTIVYGRNGKQITDALLHADGYIDVFRSNNKNYSYVLLDERRNVKQVAEKIVVSDTATSGCYGFKDVTTYRQHYRPGEDIYVSSVFKRMLTRNCAVVASERHSEEDTIVLGTADQYLNESLVRLS